MFFTLNGCISSNKASSISISNDGDDKIIFLNYSIHIKKKKKVELTNYIISEGKLKTNSERKINPKKGDLKCTQLDSESREINHIYIEDPLNKSIEYVDDQGNLNRKQITLEDAIFTIRMQVSRNAKIIFIEEWDDTQSKLKRLSKNTIVYD